MDKMGSQEILVTVHAGYPAHPKLHLTTGPKQKSGANYQPSTSAGSSASISGMASSNSIRRFSMMNFCLSGVFLPM